MKYLELFTHMKIYKAFLLGSLALLLSPISIYALSASDQFDKAVSEHAKTKRVKFRDDHTNISGKAYDFAKATASWCGIPGTAIDAVDFGMSVKDEGLNSGNILAFTAKTIASNIDLEIVGKQIKGMTKGEIITILKEKNLFDPKVLDQQGRLLAYITETSAKVSSSPVDGSGKAALEGLLIDIVTKCCKTCDVAHKGYELAKESGKAAELAFDNSLTQDMFSHMDKRLQIDNFKDFEAEYLGNKNYKDEARKALSLYHKSRGIEEPSDHEVMKYIFSRYKRWKVEKGKNKEEADILAKMKEEYLKLSSSQKRDLFGDGDEAQWASKFTSQFLGVYKELLSHKGNSIVIPGGEKEARVLKAAMNLIKKQNRSILDYNKIFATELKYLGWKKPAENLTEDQVNARSKHVLERISRLDHKRFKLVMDYMGIKIPEGFYNCLCRSQFTVGSGGRYSPEPSKNCNSSLPCKGGNLGCVVMDLPKKTEVWQACMNIHRIGGDKKTGNKGKALNDYISEALQQGRLK